MHLFHLILSSLITLACGAVSLVMFKERSQGRTMSNTTKGDKWFLVAFIILIIAVWVR